MDKNLEPRLSQRTKSRRARRLHRDTNPLSSTGPPSQSNGEEEIKTKEDERGLQKRIPCLDTLKLIDDAVLNRSQVYSSTSHNVKGASLIELHNQDRNLCSNEKNREDDAENNSFRGVNSAQDVKKGYEYLNHSADIQLHAWGGSLSQALTELVRSMMGYMVNLENIEIDENESKRVFTEGHDNKSMVYNFLNEWLFLFHDCGFISMKVEILSIQDFTINSLGRGELFDYRKHVQEGTEIKAITYSNMQVLETESGCHICVILDV